MKRIVFFGAKEIGRYCLSVLLDSVDREECDLLAFGGSSRLKSDEGFSSLLEGRNVQVLSNPDELLSLEYDILISVQYDRILNQKHLDAAKEINVNLHMAPLPEYRGCNQFSFAILDQKREFGTSLHLMTPEADAGDLLFESRFKMGHEEWVQDLFTRTVEESKLLFSEHFKDLLAGTYRPIPQNELIQERGSSFHLRKEIGDIKQVNATWPIERQKLHFRASFFPPFEPPVLIDGEERKKLDMNWYESLE